MGDCEKKHWKGTAHALDPISRPEIVKAVAAVKKSRVDDAIRFNVVDVEEPPKLALLSGETTRRVVSVTFQVESKALVARVDVGSGTVLETRELEGGQQPMLTPDDCLLAESVVKDDPRFKSLLAERYGILDTEKVACDPWSVHCTGSEPFDTSKRLVQTFLYARDSEIDNAYAKPLDALPVVDLVARKVVHIGIQGSSPELGSRVEVPMSYNYHPKLLSQNSLKGCPTAPRQGATVPRPLEIIQPEGPSFTVEGQLVRWDKWTLRVGFNHREGLVLNEVRFAGELVVWRASLVEMAVPYADAEHPFQRKCAFDVGDYGLGYCANSLGLGCDCLGHIHYFDATLSDSKGDPYTVEKAVCMHEEDDGILWKHMEYRTGHAQSRRSRKLVLSFIATVVNYEYLFYWYCKQDGTLSLEIKLTGMLSTNSIPAGSQPQHGTLVAPLVNAQVHQHMFCARLDMAVGGHENSIAEVDVETALQGEDENPWGNVFLKTEKVLKTEKEAQREADASVARTWRIFNGSRTNGVSKKTMGYKLVPFVFGPAQPSLLTHPDSMVAKRGVFATKSVWVTRYREGQRWPAGDYTVQSDGREGRAVERWAEGDESIEGQDLVVYHSFGVCHVPRPEDFPVMPCESTGFMLKPDSFLVCNPSIDLPESASTMSKCNQCGA